MSPIKRVAVFGASGTLGSSIVRELLKSGFIVTAVTRAGSNAQFPAELEVKRADLTSAESITEAIRGQDAVISAAATAAVGSQQPIMDAVIAAKVSRFIPSEFGIPTRETSGTKFGELLAVKVRNNDELVRLAEQHEWFSWTAISNGLFFDWTIEMGNTFLDVKNMKAHVVDSGNERFSTSNLSFIGKAVVAVLQKPKETANKTLHIASFTPTVNEVIKIAEAKLGKQFQVDYVSGSDLEKMADDKIARQDFSGGIDYLKQYLWADGGNHALKLEDSALSLLGMEEEDLRSSVDNILAQM
ncbi:hypothetical protein ACHAQH_005963 [Verticillium albo-atrum]